MKNLIEQNNFATASNTEADNFDSTKNYSPMLSTIGEILQFNYVKKFNYK